jgi:1,4-alpha-glucan branching enzyme
MLKKRNFRKENVVKVTFMLPPDIAEEEVRIVGDFTNWDETEAMKRQKDGSWKATVALEPGREYQFRYLVDRARWENDPDADGYEQNPYGTENSIIRT